MVIDAVSRLIPGVLGNAKIRRGTNLFQRTLEYPQYTRPEDFRSMKVPAVLLSATMNASSSGAAR